MLTTLFWIYAILLFAAVTGALALGPFWLARRATVRSGDGGLAVLKHQLAELDADIAAGRIVEADGDGLRIELSRRILSAARAIGPAQQISGSSKSMALAALVPLVAMAIYMQVGRPDLPDVPRAERLATAQARGDTDALIAQVEDHLAKKPDDAEGWKLLVPIYIDTGRFSDAAAAQMQIMALKGETADLKAGVAEALTLRDRGLMPELAIQSAMDAYRLDPKNPKAQYYHAFALSQTGHKVEALAFFSEMIDRAPADAPWRNAVNDQIKRLSAQSDANELTAEQTLAAQNLSADDQKAMIRSMVEGLDARLATNGDDVQGWLRLIRARSVLGETEKAKAALAKARGQFAGNTEVLTAVNALAAELKLP